MRRKPRKYTDEFKRKAVELGYARGSITEVSWELDISKSALSRWRREMDQYGDNSFPEMCCVLGVSKSSYYNWLKEGPSRSWVENQELPSLIRSIFQESHGSYGSPRIREELVARGHRVSRPRVARIMRANHLFARRRRKSRATTDSKHNYPMAPNLLEQNFDVVRTKQGWSYLTVIIDLFDRKVVGWSLGDNLTTSDTIIKAWGMAIRNRPIDRKLIFHSDRGIQYACRDFTNIIKGHKGIVEQSMGRKLFQVPKGRMGL